MGRQVEAHIRNFGGEAAYRQTDVRREKVQAFVDAYVATSARIDIAFNHVGIVNPQLVKLHEQPSADFLDVLNTTAIKIFNKGSNTVGWTEIHAWGQLTFTSLSENLETQVS